MPPKLKFSEGEKVLCFHGPLIYEAKALRSQITKDKQVKYFIHYAGWNKNWDEWVPENRVLKYNEANVQRQKELSKVLTTSSVKSKKGTIVGTVSTPKPKKPDSTSSSGKDSDSRASTPSKELGNKDEKSSTPAAVPAAAAATTGTIGATVTATNTTTTTTASASASRGRSSKPSSTSSSSSSAATPTTPAAAAAIVDANKDEATKKKRGRFDQTAESEEQFIAKVEVKIKIPDDLKPWLVDDWDAINRQQKLIDIPAKKTVQDIVNEYITHKKSSKTTTANKGVAITDVTTSLIEYFDVMLGCQLLYKFERPQYAELLDQHPNRPMSTLYGSFHLLRLFVRIGSMLAFTTLDEKSVQLLLVHLQDFLKYLVKNSSTLFSMQQFVNVSSEYHRKIQ